MHDTFRILWWAWSAVFIVYIVLSLVAFKRLRGPEKKRSEHIFWVIAALAAIRISIRLVLGGGLIYRFAVVLVGLVAAIATLNLIRALMTQKADEGKSGGTGRIHSLKLN
jgi:hypothetical protein